MSRQARNLFFLKLDRILIATYNCFTATICFMDEAGIMIGNFTKKKLNRSLKQNRHLTEAYQKMNEEGRKVLDLAIQKLAEVQWNMREKENKYWKPL